jgi:hypothetical protein
MTKNSNCVLLKELEDGGIHLEHKVNLYNITIHFYFKNYLNGFQGQMIENILIVVCHD